MEDTPTESFNQPKPSRGHKDDDLINTILPSYHMFQATVSKTLEPNEESFKEDPPRYELSPLNSAGLTPVSSQLNSAGLPNTLASTLDGMMSTNNITTDVLAGIDGTEENVFNHNSADFWDRTVLANIHNLESLSGLHNVMTRNLDVDVVFTESVCQLGIRPKIVDLSKTEHHQGDYLHGYVTLKNSLDKPIPFDMVYVAFEGILCARRETQETTATDRAPLVVHKFLNMLDLFASWSYANITRLSTDNGDPHDWCEGETDPQDGTILSINIKRMFMPGVTYKRFFSFRIPERLLDDCCGNHSLDIHCKLPPSLGYSYSLNKPHKYLVPNLTLKDLSLSKSFVSYAVSARVIGRASHYGVRVRKDQYVLAAEKAMPIRLIPYPLENLYTNMYNHEVSMCFKDLKSRAASKIEQGRLVAESTCSESESTFPSFLRHSANSSRTSLSSLSVKIRHLYVQPSRGEKSHRKAEKKFYRHISLFKKKSLTGSVKGTGTLCLSTPQASYKFTYVPPPEFRNPFQDYHTKINIPIEISYMCDRNDGGKIIPTIKRINAELVVLTISSEKHEIPIEFNHEMCFDDKIVDDMGIKKSEDLNDFEEKVVKPFRKYYSSLISLMKTIGFDDPAFRVETRLFKDIKSLASIQTKKTTLPLSKVSVSENVDGMSVCLPDLQTVEYDKSLSPVSPQFDIYIKKLDVEVDLNNCQWKLSPDSVQRNGLDLICLVPDFQKCFMSRMYYLRLSVKYRHGVTQLIHVPVTIHG